jgi:uncharacterized protein (DUF697 family)
MEDNTKKTEKIISNHIIYAMTAGAIPVPVADIVAVSAIQYDMIRQIAEIYNANYDTDKGKALASSLVGATVSRIGASALKAIPGVGTILGIGSQVLMAGATTYALGKIFDSYFSGNKNLDNFNIDAVKKQYSEFVSKGKVYAKELKKNFSRDDVFDTIEKLSQLKSTGAITEEEFQKTKEKLLNKIG